MSEKKMTLYTDIDCKNQDNDDFWRKKNEQLQWIFYSQHWGTMEWYKTSLVLQCNAHSMYDDSKQLL